MKLFIILFLNCIIPEIIIIITTFKFVFLKMTAICLGLKN